MKLALVLLSAIGLVAAQAVTTPVAPTDAPPEGCTLSAAGTFEIVPADTAHPNKDLQKRWACGGEGTLVVTIADGVVKDVRGHTAYIASNFQFQFDAPPQAGAIYTAGFSVCGNGSLALGDSTVWWQCASGDFSNVYDRNWAEQCKPMEVMVRQCGGGSDGGTQIEHPVATEAQVVTIIVPLSDGQPQVITTTIPVPLCEITDGQAQVRTRPCESITPTAPAGPPMIETTDGQVQIPSVVPTPTGNPPEATNPPYVPSGPGSVPGSVPSPPGSVPSGNVSHDETTVATATPPAVTEPSPPVTSTPANSRAGHISLGSTVSALLAGLVGAVLFL